MIPRDYVPMQLSLTIQMSNHIEKGRTTADSNNVSKL
jgi:hypothetical protein